MTSSENVYFWRTDFNIGSKDHLYYTYWWQYSGVNTANQPAACDFNGRSGEPGECSDSALELGAQLLRRDDEPLHVLVT